MPGWPLWYQPLAIYHASIREQPMLFPHAYPIEANALCHGAMMDEMSQVHDGCTPYGTDYNNFFLASHGPAQPPKNLQPCGASEAIITCIKSTSLRHCYAAAIMLPD